jgi:hypothetical protein
MNTKQMRKIKTVSAPAADSRYKRDAYDAAVSIARFCQTSLRGRHAREEVQLKRWDRANMAAYRIQVRFIYIILPCLVFFSIKNKLSCHT